METTKLQYSLTKKKDTRNEYMNNINQTITQRLLEKYKSKEQYCIKGIEDPKNKTIGA